MDWETKTRSLSPGYGIEVDAVDQDTWTNTLLRFDDASIYQTSAYGEVRWGRDNLSHLLLSKNDNVVAATQARIVTFPLINNGVAYVGWGPMWRSHGVEEDLDIFRQMVRALRNEYVLRRGLLLRLRPNVIDERASRLESILKDEGFTSIPSAEQYRTFLVDLRPPIDDLRKGLKQRWRNYLKRAEKSDMEICEGHDNELYDLFADAYQEMHKRKQFVEYMDVEEFRLIQEALPHGSKMRIAVCKSNGQPCSAIVCAVIGNTGVYLFGATSDVGLKARGSYLLHWRMLEWLKRNGYQWYDLCGIDPVNKPGTYQFKAGLAEKNGKDVRYIHQFDACANFGSLIPVRLGDLLRSNYRRLRERVNRRSHPSRKAEKRGGGEAPSNKGELVLR